jgi:hypothetical protein
MIWWILIIVLLFVGVFYYTKSDIPPRPPPLPMLPIIDTPESFHKLWNSIVLANHVNMKKTVESVWVWGSATPNTNEVVRPLSQRPHFREGTFFIEGSTSIPLEFKGYSLTNGTIELKIVNYVVCKLIVDGNISTFIKIVP